MNVPSTAAALAPRAPIGPALARLAAALVLLAFVVASFVSVDLHLADFLSRDNLDAMRRFVGELSHPVLAPAFLGSLAYAALETVAMSALGTLIAALLALVIVFRARAIRPLLNGLRAGSTT